MIKVYVDRNVNVQKIKGETKDVIGEILVNFIQWPLEGKSKRIQEYGLPSGDICWNDLNHIFWSELDFCNWNDFQPTEYFDQILLIVGHKNRKDCMHFDIAVKNKCSFFLTSDNDFLKKKERLQSLVQIQIYDPENSRDLQDFLKKISLLRTNPQ